MMILILILYNLIISNLLNFFSFLVDNYILYDTFDWCVYITNFHHIIIKLIYFFLYVIGEILRKICGFSSDFGTVLYKI
jgi:hypothetical protein